MIGICAIAALRRLARRVKPDHVMDEPTYALAAQPFTNTTGKTIEAGTPIYYDAASGKALPAPSSQLPASAAAPLWSGAGEALKKLQAMEAAKHYCLPTLHPPPAESPRHVVILSILDSRQAKSLITGDPIETPCGRPCHVATLGVRRLALPETWELFQVLPCTRGQARQVLGRCHAEGRLSFHELADAHPFLEQFGAVVPCTVKETL